MGGGRACSPPASSSQGRLKVVSLAEDGQTVRGVSGRGSRRVQVAGPAIIVNGVQWVRVKRDERAAMVANLLLLDALTSMGVHDYFDAYRRVFFFLQSIRSRPPRR